MSGQDRRALIIQNAMREFARCGYRGASTASIAAESGCSEPMLYKHFKNKLELFAETLVITSHPIEEAFDDLFASPGNILDNMRAFLPGIFKNELYTSTMRMRTLAMSMMNEPIVRERLSAINERLTQRVRRAIERGHRDGSIRKDADVEYVVWMWVGIQYSGCYHETMKDGGFSNMLPHALSFIDQLDPRRTN